MLVSKSNLKSFISFFKEYSVISPQKVSLAITNTIVILRALELGGSALSISIISFLNIVSVLLISTVAPKFLDSYRTIGSLLVSSYFVMSVSIFLMLIPDLTILYISSVILFISSQFIYYAVYMSINLNGYRDKSIFLSHLAIVGGVAWVGGLLIGSLLTLFLDLTKTIEIVAFIPLAGFFYMLFNFYKRKSLYPKENKVLKNRLDRKVILRSSLLTMNPVKFFTAIRKIFPVRIKYLLLTILLVQLSISIAFTHLIPYVTIQGFTYSEVFIFSLFSSILSSITYFKAGQEYNGRNSLLKAMGYRFFTYFVFIVFLIYGSLFFSPLYLVTIIILFSLIGVSWGYLYINLSTIILHLNRKDMSYANLIGGLGNTVGVIVSGLIFLKIPYQLQLSLSATVLSLAIIIVAKKPILRSNLKTRVMQITVAIQSVSRANSIYNNKKIIQHL